MCGEIVVEDVPESLDGGSNNSRAAGSPDDEVQGGVR